MKRKRTEIKVLMACASFAMTQYPGIAPAATCEKWAGKVVSAQGTVEVKPAGETRWQAVKIDETYCPGDTIRTDRRSRADIALYNHPILRLDQNSTVTFGGMKDEKTSLVDIINGAALFFSRVTRNLEVRTATVNAGVEGTEFFIRAEEGKTDLSVFEGKVLASNAAGALPVSTGQSAVSEAGKAPVYRVVVRPRDAVHWALHYPPVIESRPADLEGDSGDPRFYTTRASRLLDVGRVDEAAADIDKAQKLDPNNSDAFALQAIVAVAQNEKGKALDLAGKAVAANPKSATARIALSYAQQARFNLQGALSSLEEAVKLAPENAMAWARLAEVRQSFGYLDKSLDAAKKAAALNPDLSRTQTVLGFSHLTRNETKEAGVAFDKAIRLDDADPLPRLGLGLAKIRDGRLEGGRREIEIAMSLDPNNSLIRSYLGKAYYEEKRDKLAMGQYEMAKSLDPSDPTPYFYDAIQKQTTNRPVEALQDMENAIARNDNRAVYRSRLLLDQDLAARSASLARIYGDLGFQDLALVEGWKSVNTDPGNHSAHRFLADSYGALPRHEIARVSELLQSQLLQPINITPVQPRLAESNLFVVSGGGPSNLSFNEYNPLFERNRAALLLDGILGQHDTAGGEAVGSMVANNISASVGYYGYRTDGFRVNNGLDDRIFDLFAQVSLSPRTSAQLEYRNRQFEAGDLTLRWFPDDFLQDLRQTLDAESWRLGFRHAFAPGSDLIGNFMLQERTTRFIVDFPGVLFFEDKTEPDAYSGEIQYLHRASHINVVFGAGYLNISGDETFRQDFLLDPTDPTLNFVTTSAIDSKNANFYLYGYLNFLKDVTVTLGISGDYVNSDQTETYDRSQYNPKLGITWNPVPGTTLRAAAFRVLKRTFISDQTLEPTQVAGFNQFYDDVDSTDSWRYGAAVDQKFGTNLYGGLEYTKRDMEVPLPLTGLVASDRVDWDESLGRAYLNWAPHRWVALNGAYLYGKIDRDPQFAVVTTEMKTQQVPLGVNFFHPSGLGAGARVTNYYQSGTFSTFDPVTGAPILVPDSDRFWLCDAAVSYRLPERYGMVIIGAKNLFNQSFKFYDTDESNPSIQPSRMFFAKINLSL